jgi:lipid-binding SYLF domain-containing protein
MLQLGRGTAAIALVSVAGLVSVARGQFREDETVRLATAVFQENISVPLGGIPRALLANSHGIAIIPNVLKGSFIVGARHGYGVLLIRDGQGSWHAPMFVSLTGGNVGWQVGVQATDVILVFKTRKSIDGILAGKFTLGADAAAAAGPVGRNASAATDTRLQAEIYSYSRARGLFAGVSIDGSVIQVDAFANAAYYRSPGPGQPPAVPAAAVQLVHVVAAYAGAGDARSSAVRSGQSLPGSPQPPDPRYATEEADVLRGQLARIAPELYELLDPQWRGFLALPAEVFQEGPHPSGASLQESLSRFDRVAQDANFASLATRPEFQSTYGLLRHYVGAQSMADQALQLPPPPLGSGLGWNEPEARPPPR